MASVNKVMLIGNLGGDPEKRVTGTGQAVTNFNMATTDRWTDKGGQKQERTEWHRIVVWGPQADSCAQYLAKGRQVYVEGSLRTRQWQDRDGNTRYTTEVIAQRVQFLGGPRGERTTEEPAAAPETNTTPSLEGGGGADDVPF